MFQKICDLSNRARLEVLFIFTCLKYENSIKKIFSCYHIFFKSVNFGDFHRYTNNFRYTEFQNIKLDMHCTVTCKQFYSRQKQPPLEKKPVVYFPAKLKSATHTLDIFLAKIRIIIADIHLSASLAIDESTAHSTTCVHQTLIAVSVS